MTGSGGQNRFSTAYAALTNHATPNDVLCVQSCAAAVQRNLGQTAVERRIARESGPLILLTAHRRTSGPGRAAWRG